MADRAHLEVVRTVAPIDPSRLDEPVGAPAMPPGDWFTPPDDMPEDAKLIVVLDGPDAGRVFGRVAPRSQCLLKAPGECWTISDSPTAYRGAMQGETILDDGRVIRTANIGGAVRHAPTGLDGRPAASFTEAVDWYENTASRLMRVRYGGDEHGVWVAGALRPGVTIRTALDIIESPVSGDWRWREELDAYDMAGVVLVNMPGFPLGVKSRAASSWGEPLIGTWTEVEAMVASLDGPAEAQVAATFTAGQRKTLAKSGAAMSDGSFPIRNRSDLHNAIQAFGRAKNKAAAKAHIIKRARALGLTSMLPENWRGSTKAASASDCVECAQTASPTGEDMPDELDEEVPEYITVEEAKKIAADAVAAALAPYEDRFKAVEGDVGTLTEMALANLDSAIPTEDPATI